MKPNTVFLGFPSPLPPSWAYASATSPPSAAKQEAHVRWGGRPGPRPEGAGRGGSGARRPARPAALGPESPRAESVSCAKAKLLEAEDRFHRNAVPCTERRILAAIRKYLKN